MKRLLVIRLSALGDVAMLVPVVQALAQQHPEIEVTMLSQQHFADLFVGMPKNVRFVGVDLKNQSLLQIISSLGSYDLVADMHAVIRSFFMRMTMRLKGARVAVIDKGRHEKRQLIHGRTHTPLKHTIERYCDVLASLGLPVRLPKTPHTEGHGIGIAPFAAHQGKIYPIERMERVVQRLSQQGEQIVLFGSKTEAAVLKQWAQTYPGVKSIAGEKSLSEELEVMRGLKMMITMDSANMHLASLVGTRVLSIWGATHPYAGFTGYGQDASDCIQRDLSCRPCSIYGNKPCRYKDFRCMDIMPEEIVQRIMNDDRH